MSKADRLISLGKLFMRLGDDLERRMGRGKVSKGKRKVSKGKGKKSQKSDGELLFSLQLASN